MVSGIIEMVLRIAVVILFIDKSGFLSTSNAQVSAWAGALQSSAFNKQRQFEELLSFSRRLNSY